MAFNIPKLPYNHRDSCKPTTRITYHSDGTKTVTHPREHTPDPFGAELFQAKLPIVAQALEKGDLQYTRVRGEYDNYDMTRNKRVENIETIID
jgi:hypothetical protein